MRRWIVVLVLAGACSQGFSPWGDEATIVLSWSIDGAAADPTLCTAVGGERVRMSVNSEPVDWFDDRLEWNCADGGATLDSMFRTGQFHMRWDLVDGDGEVISRTDWITVQVAEGPTEISDIDFPVE